MADLTSLFVLGQLAENEVKDCHTALHTPEQKSICLRGYEFAIKIARNGCRTVEPFGVKVVFFSPLQKKWE